MSDSNLASILIGVAQMIGTCISTLLMDRLGRRPLLFISAAMMIVCLTTFGTYQNYVRYNRDPEWMEYMGLASIIGFSFSFAIGEGFLLIKNILKINKNRTRSMARHWRNVRRTQQGLLLVSLRDGELGRVVYIG